MSIGNYELMIFVADNLRELETRDLDTLHDCLQDLLVELGNKALSDHDCERLYAEIERQVEAEKRA
jgi:hypothetical protein